MRGWWKDVGFGQGEERLCVSSQSRCLDSSVGLMAATPYSRRLFLNGFRKKCVILLFIYLHLYCASVRGWMDVGFG